MIPLIIGHRGCRYKGVKENSSQAVERAVKDGVDVIEIDVIALGSEFFVYHPTVFEYLIGRNIESWVKKADSLERVLKTLNSRCVVYVDVKRPLNSFQVKALIKVIKANHSNKVIIGSLFKETLKIFRDLEPKWIINYHCLAVKKNIAAALKIGADWIEPSSFCISQKFILEAQKQGLKFVPSANDNYSKQLRYLKLGAHALAVFKPAQFKAWLKKNI